jgi:hypothetical protein
MCQYHGWSYDLTGRLIGVPRGNRERDFRKEEHRLPAVAVDSVACLVFATAAQKPATLASTLRDAGLVFPARASRFVLRSDGDETIGLNWKEAVERALRWTLPSSAEPRFAFMWPNTFVAVDESVCQLRILQPVDLETCRLLTYVYALPNSADGGGEDGTTLPEDVVTTPEDRGASGLDWGGCDESRGVEVDGLVQGFRQRCSDALRGR